MRVEETTNGKLWAARNIVLELVRHAEADAQHSREQGASKQANNDAHRAKRLRVALNILEECER
jgi:hypothetical protein